MIKQMSSRQLMDIIENTYNRLQNLEDSTAIMTQDLRDRLIVVQNIQYYETQVLADLMQALTDGQNTLRDSDWLDRNAKIVFGTCIEDSDKTQSYNRDQIVDGVYSRFGSSIHPKIIGTTTDIFNFSTVEGHVFKDYATVSITPTTATTRNNLPKYLGCLVHDSIMDQDICFGEFDEQSLDIKIRVNPGELLGTTAFNMIEIIPYIPGSFDITRLDVYTLQSFYVGKTTPDSTLPRTIPNVGISRILMENTWNLYELHMTVRIHKTNNAGKYPFGLKHIYFINATFNPESYVVVKVQQTKNIDMISEDIVVCDQTGRIDTTCKEENIELYYDWSAGVGIDSIATSKGLSQNKLIRNVRSFYLKYPIVRSVSSIKFNSLQFR